MDPNKYRSEQEAILGLEREGYSGEFKAHEDGFKLLPNGPIFDPEEVEIVEFHRFEGPTDPGDMSIVYALRSKDGTKGVLIDAFGLYSDPKLID